MTITSVVLGDGTPEGGCGEAGVGVSTDATGSRVISKGNSSFIVFLDSVWFGCWFGRPLLEGDPLS
jgi:hypothetical protein